MLVFIKKAVLDSQCLTPLEATCCIHEQVKYFVRWQERTHVQAHKSFIRNAYNKSNTAKKKAEQKSGIGNNIQVIGKKQNMQGENKKQINKIAKYKRLVLTGIKDT